MKKINTLCYLDDDQGRDVEMMLPLVFFAEQYLNCQVEFCFIWDSYAIYRKKPDLVLIANTIGSTLHFDISKYAYQQNVPVFALISEGNFRTNGTFNYWGYNTDKQFYQEYICLWSERTYKFLSEKIPQFKDRMVVTGGVGFDRYKIYKFLSKKDFLNKRNLYQYKKVIGYAGWAFGKIHTSQGREEVLAFFQNDSSRLKWMEEQRYLVEDILRKAIENNPDTLFILKKHPNETPPHILQEGTNEMNRLQHYPNVLYVRNEENLHDLIHIADIWLAFESTTVLESWIMDAHRPTIFINPDPDFKRDELFKGTLIAQSYDDLQSYINQFYQHHSIDLFEEKEAYRVQLIKETIGYGDGMNHVRAGMYLKKTVESISVRDAKTFYWNWRHFTKYALLQIGKYFYNKSLFTKLPKFKKTVWMFEQYQLSNIPKTKKLYYQFLTEFHHKHHIKEKIQQKE